MATDEQIEREIQDKGLTAARVTPLSIEAKIKGEYSATLDKAFAGAPIMDGMERVTIVALVLENGFIILGKSAPASAANFDPELGAKIARADAVNQIWPLEGYLLREQLFTGQPPLEAPAENPDLIGGSVKSDAVYRFASWLTDRDSTMILGGSHDVAVMAEAVASYFDEMEGQ